MTERVPHGTVRHVVVPDSPVMLEYVNLVDVDPATLDPAAAPEAAWWAAWDALASGTYMVPDPVNANLYIATAGSSMTPDSTNECLYTIGAISHD